MKFRTMKEIEEGKKPYSASVRNGVIKKASLETISSGYRISFKIETGKGDVGVSFTTTDKAFGKELAGWLKLFNLSGGVPEAFERTPWRIMEFPESDLYFGDALEDRFESVSGIHRQAREEADGD